ncbi:DoxX family protein [[Limnothrix rosea] IAM M-220]|uniref:DoxX family protein n=1 Tax=[Limnothrix rosea] IAM M-220 TaxID=454133 RepID=UPI000969E026|nr:DoxX family protein [[Limnothrix rosea] IAM M-220]OKH20032.1 DoxX family protein [[Limnothrix rosea] IAM M-220]
MNFKNTLTAVFKPTLEADIKSQIAWTVFRVTVGIFMVHNGLDKLSDIEGFAAAYVEYIGLPFPIFFSYVAAFTELLGAPLVALGLLTRPAAFGLFSTMLVAMYHHISVAGLSIPYLELSAIYASCFLFFTVNGAGVISIDALIAKALTGDVVDEAQRDVLEKNYQAETVAK